MSNDIGIVRFVKNKPYMSLGAGVVIILLVMGIIGLTLSGDDGAGSGTSSIVTFKVKRGPLRISVTESGTIKAREQMILKNEVEGRTSILTLIPEGTRVKKGDLLVELDSSKLLDKKIDQEIRVQNTEASYISGQENLAVVENQSQSDIDLAELTFDFAKQDLAQYLEGEYPKKIKKAQAQITLAEEELSRAKEKLSWSKKLFGEKYISQTELQVDELSKMKRALDLELAQSDLDLLENYTYQRELKQLQSDVKQAEMALERTRRKATADVKQAEANLKAKESEYNRQADKLKKIEEQIVKTKIYAPAEGLVIYATSAQRGFWRNSEPLDEGQDVRERQELIYLPIGTSVKAEVDIHESSLKKVRVELPTIITVDALPRKSFIGKVVHIAPLPDAQSVWMNPELKVYNTEIYLDGNDGDLRTGMSCKAEIIIEQYDDAIYVPIQAVLRIKGETTVFVLTGGDYEPRKVVIGLDNNRMVRIVSGLDEGEVVLLTPPLKSAVVDSDTRVIASGATDADDNSDTTNGQIQQRLKDINVPQNNGQNNPGSDTGRQQDREGRPPGTPDGKNRRPDHGQRKGFENLSSEKKEEVRKKFMNMLPVGSSAKIICGSLANARAIATRCICPPESSVGRCPSRSSRPTIRASSRARRALLWASQPR